MIDIHHDPIVLTHLAKQLACKELNTDTVALNDAFQLALIFR